MNAPFKDVVFRMAKSIEAAKLLIDGLKDVLQDDEQLLRDTIEGETDLHEILGKMLKSVGEDDALVTGLSSYIDDLKSRKDRFEKRIELKRSLMLMAMETASQESLETSFGTISVAAIAPSLIITDESLVPAQYWSKPDPVINKRDLAKDVKALPEDETIPGATLSNGGSRLVIRRK